MRFLSMAAVILSASALPWPQAPQLNSADAVLERYKQALGGVDAIKSVQSETTRGEIEATGCRAKRLSSVTPSPLNRSSKSRARTEARLSPGSTALFLGPSRHTGPALIKTLRWNRCAAMPTCNTPFTSRTTSRNSDLRASPISRAITAIGCTEPLTGAKTIINSTTSKLVYWSGTATRPTPGLPWSISRLSEGIFRACEPLWSFFSNI